MKIMEITLVNSQNIVNKLVADFVDEFWFAPNDALLRCTEALIFAKRYFEPPVLDIGIGDARVSKHLFSMNQLIDMGIDVNPKGLKLASKSNIYKKVEVEDATNMTFKAGSFSTVISNSTFEHIENDIKAVKEVARILKNGGRFYLTVPLPNHEKFLQSFGMSKIDLEKYNKRVDHFHYRSLSQWKEILRRNKLKVINHKSYFPKSVDRTWLYLHKITTFRPYKRELWSYLKDSPYGKLFPSFIVKPILREILRKNIKNAFRGKGAWIFIVSEKET